MGRGHGGEGAPPNLNNRGVELRLVTNTSPAPCSCSPLICRLLVKEGNNVEKPETDR